MDFIGLQLVSQKKDDKTEVQRWNFFSLKLYWLDEKQQRRKKSDKRQRFQL